MHQGDFVFTIYKQRIRYSCLRNSKIIRGEQIRTSSHPELIRKKDILLREKIYNNYVSKRNKVNYKVSNYGKSIVYNFVNIVLPKK